MENKPNKANRVRLNTRVSIESEMWLKFRSDRLKTNIGRYIDNLIRNDIKLHKGI